MNPNKCPIFFKYNLGLIHLFNTNICYKYVMICFCIFPVFEFLNKLFYKKPWYYLLNLMIGGGSVGRAVASVTREP